MRIYLDHNATTPLRDEVVETMTRVLREDYGNPSSVHAEGARARELVERAREQVASLLRAAPREVVFTASATEANNTRLRALRPGQHVVTTHIEHPSVEAPLCELESAGVEVTRVQVDSEGYVAADAVADACRDDTALVAVIWANNETGVIQPVETIASEAAARGIPLHLDATQAVGKIPVDLSRVPASSLALSAHKFGGPKGSGCLLLRDTAGVEPLVAGGPQESGRRGGTENVAGIAGLGMACELAERELPDRMADYAKLRDALWEGIRESIPDVRSNGPPESRLPNTLHVEFRQTAGEVLVQALDLEGISVSAGAACASGSIEPSRVLVAMGRSPEEARGCLRFSVGHGVSAGQIEQVLAQLPDLVARVRAAEGA
ncbi:MAG: cysteine desulfurase [Myxococcales bacterium]|nr:cysteine desulfurase [Myxococcales bacterium]